MSAVEKMDRTDRQIVAAPGSPLSDAEARAAGEELLRICHGDPDHLKPADVVAAAAPMGSPIHRYFCWDNTQAAHQYRLLEAQRLLGAISIVVVDARGPRGKPQPLFLRVTKPAGAASAAEPRPTHTPAARAARVPLRVVSGPAGRSEPAPSLAAAVEATRRDLRALLARLDERARELVPADRAEFEFAFSGLRKCIEAAARG